MGKFDVYGIGAALVDTEIEVTDADLQAFGVPKGLMTLVDEPRQHELIQLLEGHLVTAKRASGGSAANSVIAAQYFGATTFYSCKVADDDNGRFYLADLAAAGVAYPDNCCVSDGITGKCLVMITDDAERTMNTYLGVSATLSHTEIDYAALKQSKFAYIEGYLVTSETGRPAAVQLKKTAQQQGVRTAFSLSDPGIVEFFHEGLSEIIGAGVDLLFCNEAEALAFTRTENLEAALEQLKLIARTFAVTRGPQGAVVFDGETFEAIAAPTVKAVDTNGAGDMFAGAFLYALSQGWSYADAGTLATRAASKVVSQFGPRLAPDQYSELLE